MQRNREFIKEDMEIKAWNKLYVPNMAFDRKYIMVT